ncbi:hypothetical protein ABZ990_25030 [Streptomyces sp. NPDC046203]|uniref:hypothetical protein n=1 Tax=Streptomyces sp. NPDC046203 TaxID=3154602 RepID=UPI00340222FB
MTGAPGPKFHVLLGPDGAGKSTAMKRIAELRPDWRLLSADSRFTGAEHAFVSELRRGVVREVLPGLGAGAYSRDFLTSVLQTAVVHLRDLIAAQPPGVPVLVDSYYYKTLAKCRIFGDDDHPLFAWWRSFPQPAGVVFLDVAPATAWRRSRGGRLLNPFEYPGDEPEWFSFESYHHNLRKLLLEEVRHVPVTLIDQPSSPDRAAAAVLRAVSR